MNLDAFLALFGDDLEPEIVFGSLGLSARARRRLQAAGPAERSGSLQPSSRPTTSVTGKACSQT